MGGAQMGDPCIAHFFVTTVAVLAVAARYLSGLTIIAAGTKYIPVSITLFVLIKIGIFALSPHRSAQLRSFVSCAPLRKTFVPDNALQLSRSDKRDHARNTYCCVAHAARWAEPELPAPLSICFDIAILAPSS